MSRRKIFLCDNAQNKPVGYEIKAPATLMVLPGPTLSDIGVLLIAESFRLVIVN